MSFTTKESGKFESINNYSEEIFEKESDTYFLLDDHQIEIGKRICNQKLRNINEYDLYADSDLVSLIIDAFLNIINKELDNDIDFIIGLGQSGAPLAYLLAQELNKKVFILNEKNIRLPNSRIFLPEPEIGELKGKKVLLCDSIMRSGYTAYKHYQILKSKKISKQYFITMIFNHNFFNKRISKDMSDLFYCPLLYWNDDFRKKFQKFKQPREVLSNLRNQWDNSKERESLIFISYINKLFDFINEFSEELSIHSPNLSNKFIKIKEKLDKNDDNDYNTSRFHSNQFHSYVNDEEIFLTSNLYSTLFASSEKIEDYFRSEKYKTNLKETPRQLKKNVIEKIRNLFKENCKNPGSKEEIDYFLSTILFNYIWTI